MVGPSVSGEDMRKIDLYRRGLVVDYPTDRAARAGSCIFIHVWRGEGRGTAGCVALPEARVAALQEFAADGHRRRDPAARCARPLCRMFAGRWYRRCREISKPARPNGVRRIN